MDNLYSGFGFKIRHGSDHDVVSHPDFTDHLELRATLPRHSELATAYVRQAVVRIEILQELQRIKEMPDEHRSGYEEQS